MPVECHLLPHGAYTLFPAVFSTIAWLASLAQDGCDYARLSGPLVEDLTVMNVRLPPYLEVGFNAYREPIPDSEDPDEWDIDYTAKCIEYNPDFVTMDGYWKSSKGFAFLALVFGGGGSLFLWFSSCFVFSPGTWRWAGYEIFAASFFQGLGFLWFRTDMCQNDGNQCDLFFGSKSDIAAAALFFVSALAIFVRYPKPQIKEGDTPLGRRGQEIQTAEVEQMERDDDSGGEDGYLVGGRTGREMELPVEGAADATLPPPIHDPALETSRASKVPDTDII